MTRHLLYKLICCVTAVLLCGCVATPLSRSYDDPYNSPLPNETAPPSLTAQEEQCTRDPVGSCGVGTKLCTRDKDCRKDEICQNSVCVVQETGAGPP